MLLVVEQAAEDMEMEIQEIVVVLEVLEVEDKLVMVDIKELVDQVMLVDILQ